MTETEIEAEPWIEALIQNYGQRMIKGVTGRVVALSEVPESELQAENAVALLFLSDREVQIPAILTRPAWEEMREKEDRETVSNLKNSTVFLQRYSLEFQREAEMCNSRFFLMVNRLSTVAAWRSEDKVEDVPCCAMLPSVRQQIHKTWRSLQGENSCTTVDTQSGYCLTQVLGEWQQERLGSLLLDLEARLASEPSSSPSSSQDPPPPAAARPRHTRWDTDRLRDRGQVPFSVPVSHLCIPAEQSRQLQTCTERRETEPPETQVSASSAEHEERSLPDSGTDGGSLLGSGQQEGAPANPWDILAPSVGNLSTSSSEMHLSESVSPDLLVLDRDPAADPPVGVPMATSTQVPPLQRSCSRELFPSSDHNGESEPGTAPQLEGPALSLRPHLRVSQSSTDSSTPSLLREVFSGSDCQTLPPYQKPRPADPPSSSSTLHPAPLPHAALTHPSREDTPTARSCGGEGEEDIVIRRLGRSRKRQQTPLSEAEEVVMAISADEEGEGGCSSSVGKRKPSQRSSPPSWLFQTQASATERGPPPPTRVRSDTQTHPDGTPFTYSYQPTLPVAKAMSLVKIPDDFLQWSARYLINTNQSENTS
ncbi:hypothetical protein MATL_G00145420 [Megalops atlanticus]|uniref:Shelterin complex subunit TPP1/Est3 domain-containing protein n=1 Tax=Megalops atlanticus TaxID=7932 RepID=A0A9D3PYS7_MEGAT|nr:hypothetical protein MATL_G00145420 [Megalops atlanticus]